MSLGITPGSAESLSGAFVAKAGSLMIEIASEG
jgi:hypothetical protein